MTEAFTSGGLAAWGVPFLELARTGRTDVWVSAAPSFKSSPYPSQQRGQLTRGSGPAHGLARHAGRVRPSKETASKAQHPTQLPLRGEPSLPPW